MNDALKKEAEALAVAAYPNECCGYVLSVFGEEKLFPCRNVHPNPRGDFRVGDDDVAAAYAAGAIVGFYHSHPDGIAYPSPLDRVHCREMDVPFYIFAYPRNEWCEILPDDYELPLLGRTFEFGVVDCFTLMRDYFARTHGILLTNYPRKDKFWDRGENLYMDNLEREGFVVVQGELKPDDCFLHKIRSPIANHVSIYRGNNTILHHACNRLSVEEPLAGIWLKTVFCPIRHKSLL